MTQQTDWFSIEAQLYQQKSEFTVGQDSSMVVNAIKLVFSRQFVLGDDLTFGTGNDYLKNRQSVVGIIRKMVAWYKEFGHDNMFPDSSGDGVIVVWQADNQATGRRNGFFNLPDAVVGDADPYSIFLMIGNDYGGSDTDGIPPDRLTHYVDEAVERLIEKFLESTTGN